MVASSSEYRVNIIISSKDKTSTDAKKAASGLDILTAAAKLAAIGYAGLKVAQEAIKFIKFGADVQRAANSLDNLAAAAGESGAEIVTAIQGASDFTIDRMTAMSSANKAMLLDVAKSPDEFARLTKQAVLLGRAMGKDAASSIDDFVTAAGRQSKMIADNLGLMVSAEDANKRYAASHGITVDAMDDAMRKQAFLQEMLRQAEAKTGALEDGNLDLAGSYEQITAALKDAQAGLAEYAAEQAATIMPGRDFSEWLRGIPDTIRAQGDAFKENAPHYRAYNAMIADTTLSIEWQTRATLNNELALLREETRLEGVMNAAAVAGTGVQSLGTIVGSSTEEFEAHSIAIAEADAQYGLSLASIREYEQATADLAIEQANLADKLTNASDAAIAKAAIDELSNLLESKKISVEDYKTAVTQTQLAFGLADEKSIALTESIFELTAKFGEGEIKAEDFDTALLNTIREADQLNQSLSGMKRAIEEIPAEKTVRINVEYVSSGSGSGYGHAAPGQSVTNAPTYVLNQTVNTQATTHNVLRDYETARAQVE